VRRRWRRLTSRTSPDNILNIKIVHFVDDRVQAEALVPYCRAVGDCYITWDADHVTCRRCLEAFRERMDGY
jgi:hypothetical protein